MNLTTLDQSLKLKELGLPQNTFENNTRFSYWYYGGEKGWSDIPHESRSIAFGGFGVTKTVAAYSLGELIDLLGDDFKGLRREKTTWCAIGNPKPIEGIGRMPGFYRGPTSLEAVYNLVLKVYE